MSTSHSEDQSGSFISYPAAGNLHLAIVPHPADKVSQCSVLSYVIVAGRNWHLYYWASLSRTQRHGEKDDGSICDCSWWWLSTKQNNCAIHMAVTKCTYFFCFLKNSILVLNIIMMTKLNSVFLVWARKTCAFWDVFGHKHLLTICFFHWQMEGRQSKSKKNDGKQNQVETKAFKKLYLMFIYCFRVIKKKISIKAIQREILLLQMCYL